MYGHRLWGTPNAFTPEEVAFHTEPYADARQAARELGRVRADDRATARWKTSRASSSARRCPTLVLYGPEDHVVLPSFPWKAAAACIDCTGPLFVPNAGHFLQWESADTFNKITAAFCRT